VNSVAAPGSARPLYAEFLARVIDIEVVQCYCPAVTDDHTARFFAEGRRPGVFGDFLWSLNAPEAFPWGLIAPATSEEPVSLPMHRLPAMAAEFARWPVAVIVATGGEPAITLGTAGTTSTKVLRRSVTSREWRGRETTPPAFPI
jgi:hypothetical protein